MALEKKVSEGISRFLEENPYTELPQMVIVECLNEKGYTLGDIALALKGAGTMLGMGYLDIAKALAFGVDATNSQIKNALEYAGAKKNEIESIMGSGIFYSRELISGLKKDESDIGEACAEGFEQGYNEIHELRKEGMKDRVSPSAVRTLWEYCFG